MNKSISRDTSTGRIIVGRASGKAFSAVEGVRPSPRTSRLEGESDAAGESGDARRDRIRRDFKK
jgi:hypothetical protein